MALPPLQPAYVLRGHAAQVHALQFSSTNSYLLSGDAEGYVVSWSLTSKRATASWRAHTDALLGVAWWTEEIVVTHGRDNQLHVWKLGPGLSSVLPVDKHANPSVSTGATPKILHSMTVNTLNFCSFAWTRSIAWESGCLCFLVALPHTLSSEAIDIFQVTISHYASDVPEVNSVRKTTVPPPKIENPRTGLTMCLDFHDDLKLMAGYESGHVIIYAREAYAEQSGHIEQAKDRADLSSWQYKPSYISRPHSQPVLSIHRVPSHQFCVTTAADAKLITHSIPNSIHPIGFENVVSSEPIHSLNTKHSGQQGLSVRDDGLLLATAGWDTKGRVYRAPAEFKDGEQTKFVSPKETAVLKWHKEGCYCTAFAHVLQADSIDEVHGVHESTSQLSKDKQALSIVEESTRVITAAQRREQEARKTHWLALGSKDGKISLWNIP